METPTGEFPPWMIPAGKFTSAQIITLGKVPRAYKSEQPKGMYDKIKRMKKRRDYRIFCLYSKI
jgi:hypothetical protein